MRYEINFISKIEENCNLCFNTQHISYKQNYTICNNITTEQVQNRNSHSTYCIYFEIPFMGYLETPFFLLNSFNHPQLSSVNPVLIAFGTLSLDHSKLHDFYSGLPQEPQSPRKKPEFGCPEKGACVPSDESRSDIHTTNHNRTISLSMPKLIWLQHYLMAV